MKVIHNTIEVFEEEYEALLSMEHCASQLYKVWNVKRVNLELLRSKVEALGMSFSHLDNVRRKLGLKDE